MDNELKSFFRNTPIHVKMDFLEKALTKDQNLQSQFKKYLKKQTRHQSLDVKEDPMKIQLALKEFKTSKTQAGILLEYLYQNDPARFAIYGEKVFNQYRQEFSSYILERLDPQENPELYKELLAFQMLQSRNISLYRIWKELSSPEEQQKIVGKCQYMPYFYGLILSEEKRFQEILVLMENLSLRDHILFGKLLPLILPNLAQEAYSLVKKRIGETLNCYRDRSTYREIIQWLKTLKDQTVISLKTQLLIRETFYRKPALPALRDEMIKAGLISSSNN